MKITNILPLVVIAFFTACGGGSSSSSTVTGETQTSFQNKKTLQLQFKLCKQPSAL